MEAVTNRRGPAKTPGRRKKEKKNRNKKQIKKSPAGKANPASARRMELKAIAEGGKKINVLLRYNATNALNRAIKKGITMRAAVECSLINSYPSVEAAEMWVADLVKVPLNQHQFDAMVSCVVNIGVMAFAGSHLLHRLNVGHYAGALRCMRNWGELDAEAQLFARPVLV